MITNNFITFFKMCLTGSTFEFNHSDGSKIDSAISRQLYGILESMGTGRCNVLSPSYPGVYYGTGSTKAKKTDVSLENLISSGLSIVDGNRVYEENTSMLTYSATHSLKNTTDEDITIREIGLFMIVNPSSSSGSSRLCLVDRIVLDEPVTIQPGEAKLVTYKITFNTDLNME